MADWTPETLKIADLMIAVGDSHLPSKGRLDCPYTGAGSPFSTFEIARDETGYRAEGGIYVDFISEVYAVAFDVDPEKAATWPSEDAVRWLNDNEPKIAEFLKERFGATAEGSEWDSQAVTFTQQIPDDQVEIYDAFTFLEEGCSAYDFENEFDSIPARLRAFIEGTTP